MKTVSVIVPVHNVEKYIGKCLQSIINQTLKDIEIIAIDDGSTDRSKEILDEYSAKYCEIIKVIHQKNQGLGGARNTGIEAANGEYIYFVDSDDFIASNTLEVLVNKAKKNNAQMVICDYYKINSSGTYKERTRGVGRDSFEGKLRDYPMLLFMPPSVCNKLIKRAVFKETLIFFPTGVWYEDLITSSKLYLHLEKIIYVPHAFYYYVQREGSIMHNKNVVRNREIILAIQDIMEYYQKQGMAELYAQEIEFLAIRSVLLLASVRVIKVDCHNNVLKEIKEYIIKEFPYFKGNKYYDKFSRKEKILLFLIFKGQYRAVFTILKLKNIILKR